MRLLLAAAASFAAAIPTTAYAETWQPVSKTAVSVTGKITFAKSEITFQNGQSLPIKAATDDGIDGQLFKVLKPADPVLLRGNTLCGRSTVKFLLIVGQGSTGRDLSVYDGKEEPTQETSSCASYSYQAGR
ncbi:hypothetical protein [Methylobacterium sp. PvR107]|uniref:hypothetical protein n=1 Tax=Methylobacterium sp. PvR107 TaxID=2806597 RepID=UPI001AE397A4|nr:hypothetical protein [Methylobacterium sp. PvR107]MBP1181449.1 hypothetical protein [Methylobacterium sp. PvR107]